MCLFQWGLLDPKWAIPKTDLNNFHSTHIKESTHNKPSLHYMDFKPWKNKYWKMTEILAFWALPRAPIGSMRTTEQFLILYLKDVSYYKIMSDKF